MRCLHAAIVCFGVLSGALAPARAGEGPVIAVPGRPGVPVMINGIDATGAVVYGDWGLARPGHGQIIIQGGNIYPEPWRAGAYYPSSGRLPGYGRDEVEPPPHPRPSTEYNRSWSTQSDTSRPVTEYPPFNPPAVIMAPPEQQQRKPHPHR